jgi:hypothetical protein
MAETATRQAVHALRFFGLLDRDYAEVGEFYCSREAAETELVEILHDQGGGGLTQLRLA